jgi:hypothetical protein
MDRFAGRIVIFEADWRFDGEVNILHQIQDWRREQRLHPTAGFCHQVSFPGCPTVSVIAWTPFLAFQHRRPNNTQLPPKRLYYFMCREDLLNWKRATWTKERLVADTSYMVHRTCHAPTGEHIKNGYLFSFDG